MPKMPPSAKMSPLRRLLRGFGRYFSGAGGVWAAESAGGTSVLGTTRRRNIPETSGRVGESCQTEGV